VICPCITFMSRRSSAVPDSLPLHPLPIVPVKSCTASITEKHQTTPEKPELSVPESYFRLMHHPNMLTGKHSGMPWSSPKSIRKPSLPTALILLCRRNSLWRKQQTLQLLHLQQLRTDGSAMLSTLHPV